MGHQALDQYSLLHFAAGVVAYFWNIPLVLWIAINFIFEAFENSTFGMNIINNISIFPGGQPRPDAPINILSDIIMIIFGWGLGYFVDYLGKKYKWYVP